MAATSSSSSGVNLTYDTILHVISVSENAKDTAQLIATCRELYHEGPKILLKKPVVIFTKHLASFLKFLRADNSSRCRYLRQMELQVFASSLEPDVTQELVEILPLLTRIEYLCLIDADQLLRLHPDLTPAFCALTTLRHIKFSRVSNKTCALLHGLRAPLISASINFICDLDVLNLWNYLDDEDDWEQYHPAVLLENFAPTLEELECVAWRMHPSQQALIATQVFPKMHRLSIDLPLRINTFIRAFPNLTDLYIDTEDYGEFSLEVMHESHARNVVQQRGVNPCGTWAHLKHFYGSVVDLYTIGITSHIPQVTLEDMLDDGPAQMELLVIMLRYARPLRLKLEGITGNSLGDADRGFISMLRDKSASNLINLDVRIEFSKDDREKDLSAVIDNLVWALTRLPLEFLELIFVTSGLNPMPNKTPRGRIISPLNGLSGSRALFPAPTLGPAELSLKNLDMDALIARLESMPSLEVAHVVVCSSRYEGDYQWEGHDRTITRDRSCMVAAGYER